LGSDDWRWLALVVIAVAAAFSLIWHAVVAVPRRGELRSALQPHL